MGEIVALFIYFYTFGKMRPRQHLTVGWIYFICAWMSLFIITGIIDFMLTPGAWLENGSFWSGFFNPTFWPSLFFRTFNRHGLRVPVRPGDRQFPERRHDPADHDAATPVKWMPLPFVLMLVSAFWYLQAIPPETRTVMLQISPELRTYIGRFPRSLANHCF